MGPERQRASSGTASDPERTFGIPPCGPWRGVPWIASRFAVHQGPSPEPSGVPFGVGLPAPWAKRRHMVEFWVPFRWLWVWNLHNPSSQKCYVAGSISIWQIFDQPEPSAVGQPDPLSLSQQNRHAPTRHSKAPNPVGNRADACRPNAPKRQIPSGLHGGSMSTPV